ncbi:hypothetical protein D9M69_404460 [compost metagenome]
MRVAQGEATQLAALLQQQAVGARRQGQRAGVRRDVFHQQLALGGAVEDAEVALVVQGEEALATLFRHDAGDRLALQLEVADMGQARFAVFAARHEPLADAAPGVADHQRDAAEQLAAGGDLGAGVVEQFVAAVELAAVQVEHVGGGAAVDDVKPLLARVHVDRLDRLGDLRQFDMLLLQRGFAGEHVFLAGQVQQQHPAAVGSGQHQAVVTGSQGDVLQRAALAVQLDGRLAVGVVDLRGDGLVAVRVGDLVAVLEHQRLAVGQAEGDQRLARLVLGDGDHMAAFRQPDGLAAQFVAGLQAEEQHFAIGGDAHRHLVLLLDAQQQRRLGGLQPGRSQRIADVQLGATEQRQHHVGEVEEDQGDGRQYGEPAHQHVPAGQTVLERTHASLALQDRRIEIDTLGERGGHGGVGQVVHGVTP